MVHRNCRHLLRIFRGAVESILAISAALSVDLLDDQMDFAYRNLGALLRQVSTYGGT